MATHSSVLAWRIPGTREPGGLYGVYGVRHSGSPQRRRLSWACVLCPSQVRAAQVMRCLASVTAVTYRLPATQLSRYTTGTPSQVDVDRSDPQEVLVSKEACLQFYR